MDWFPAVILGLGFFAFALLISGLGVLAVYLIVAAVYRVCEFVGRLNAMTATLRRIEDRLPAPIQNTIATVSMPFFGYSASSLDDTWSWGEAKATIAKPRRANKATRKKKRA